MNQREQFGVLDLITVLSFALGLQNLQENRIQTAHNDVNKANDQQAKLLLDELSGQFDEIKDMLRRALDILENAN